jgi:tRNA (cmo5U34)-methyltransferase
VKTGPPSLGYTQRMKPDTEQGVRYDARHAAAYDRKIRQLIPGYDTLHALSAYLLKDCLPADARILVAGSGSGEELTRLAALGPTWQLNGVEPSADMHALAQAKCAEAGLGKRVTLIDGKPGEVEIGDHYDAACALLVMHFLPDDGSKAAFLQALGRAVKPGGALLLADLSGERGSLAFEQLFAAWRRQQDATRDRPEQVALDFNHLARNVFPVSAARRDALLAEAGFQPVTHYWQSFALQALLARRVGGK